MQYNGMDLYEIAAERITEEQYNDVMSAEDL